MLIRYQNRPKYTSLIKNKSSLFVAVKINLN